MRRFGEGGEAEMQYRSLAPDSGTWLELCARYPDFPGSELREGGYAGVTRVVTEGGAAAFEAGQTLTFRFAL